MPNIAMLRILLDERYCAIRLRCGILIYLAVLVFGSIPGARAELGHVAPGILLHTAAYSLITFLLFTGSSRAAPSHAVKTFLLVGLLGALDELIQAALPYRTGAVADWLIDMNAAFVTLLIMHSNWFRKKIA